MKFLQCPVCFCIRLIGGIAPQTDGRSTPTRCIDLIIASQGSVESNQGGLASGVGLVVGGVQGCGSIVGGVVGVVVGRGNRWLMACAREDNCDKMVDR